MLSASVFAQAADIHVKPGESIAAGDYRIYEPIVLRPEDSGTPSSPTLIRGEKGAVVSGGVVLTGWKRQGKLMVTDVPDFCGRPLEFRQLYVNGQKAVRARDVADFEEMHRILRVDKQKQVLWVPAEAVRKIRTAPYAEMVLHEMWCVANLRIRGIEFSGDSAAVSFHDPNHWFYLYTDEGSSFITVRDNWTEAEKFLKNANGPGNVWENNGPLVNDSIKAKAGAARP